LPVSENGCRDGQQQNQPSLPRRAHAFFRLCGIHLLLCRALSTSTKSATAGGKQPVASAPSAHSRTASVAPATKLRIKWRTGELSSTIRSLMAVPLFGREANVNQLQKEGNGRNHHDLPMWNHTIPCGFTQKDPPRLCSYHSDLCSRAKRSKALLPWRPSFWQILVRWLSTVRYVRRRSRNRRHNLPPTLR
jgi:hypothetical protein